MPELALQKDGGGMKKLVVYLNDGNFINILADKMVREENFITVTNDGELVAVLDISTVLVAYISDKAVNK